MNRRRVLSASAVALGALGGLLIHPVLTMAGSFEDFFEAVRDDRVAPLQALAQRGFDLNTIDPKGQPALLMALHEGSLKVARFLVQHPSVRVDARNGHDETALMIAVLKGHLDLARQLVARDADVNKPGWTPLHYAATSTTERAVDQVQWLLEQHAYIDAESPNGTTPLMMAAQYGREDVVRLLLTEGADATLKNQLGLTALDFAKRVGRDSVARLIQRHLDGLVVAPTPKAVPGQGQW